MTTDDLFIIIGAKEARIWELNIQIKAQEMQIIDMTEQIKKLQAKKSGEKEDK